MKTIRLLASLGFLLFSVNGSLHAENAAVADVLKLKAAGLGEDTILAFIRAKGTRYDLTSDDLIGLRDKGLSPAIINAMLTNGPGSVSAAPSADAPSTAPAAPAPAPTTPPSAPVQPGPTGPVIVPPGGGVTPPLSPDAASYAADLNPYGQWILGEDNQWYWQPAVVQTDPEWRPYWDGGHWIDTEQGWYWASDYAWGGIVFHYGRWHLHPRHGWVWLPNRQWGPAWVAWRSGDEYCGWAPLPPGAYFDIRLGVFFYHGRRVEPGFEFGLDWRHYNFCYLREMGERPVRRFHTEVEIRGVWGRTVVYNHYGTVHVGGEVRFVNHGVDRARVGELRGRPVETHRIQDVRRAEPVRSAAPHSDPGRGSRDGNHR